MKRESLCGEDVDANLGVWGVGWGGLFFFFFFFLKKEKTFLKKRRQKTFFPSWQGDERGRG